MSILASPDTGQRKEIKDDVYCDDLQRVGKDKPLGCLPLNSIRKYNHEDPEEVMLLAKKRGLFAEIIQGSANGQDALFVADLGSLSRLLKTNTGTLKKYGWPTDATEFARKTMVTMAPDNTKLFDLVADAFGDKTNIGRTDNDYRHGGNSRSSNNSRK